MIWISYFIWLLNKAEYQPVPFEVAEHPLENLWSSSFGEPEDIFGTTIVAGKLRGKSKRVRR